MVAGFLFPLPSHAAALVAHAVQLHELAGVSWPFSLIRPQLLRIVVNNAGIACLYALVSYLIRHRDGDRHIMDRIIGGSGLLISGVLNIPGLFRYGRILITLTQGSILRALIAAPHGYLEFLAYSVPLSMLFGGLDCDRQTAANIAVGLGILGIFLLIPAGIVEVYVSPLVARALHLLS